MSTNTNDGGPLSEAGLSTRLMNGLRKHGCTTVGHALRIDPKSLKATWGVGEAAFNEYMRFRDAHASPQTNVSLRDFFAAHALQGMLASEVNGEGICPATRYGETFECSVARVAYRYADAMLRAREAKSDG